MSEVSKRAPEALDDATLALRLEDGSLPPSAFGHREHVRFGFYCLANENDFALAAARFRRVLRAYANAVGASGKYHETITWAWLALIREAMEVCADLGSPLRSGAELLGARPDLLDQRALASVYDVAEIARDPLARRVLVLPRRSS